MRLTKLEREAIRYALAHLLAGEWGEVVPDDSKVTEEILESALAKVQEP